jgi:hypothetical protein
MAKRRTGIGKMKRSTSHKTAKRLAIKKTMLETKAKKNKQMTQQAKKKNNKK